MPHGDPDPQDPMMLVGVGLPAGREAQVDMAYALAEEFARMGFEEQRILGLFSDPFYAGAHGAFRALGEAAVLAIIRECVGAWGRARPVDREGGRR